MESLSRFYNSLRELGIFDPKIILFGSRAHGTAHEASDIDVLVISNSFADKDYWERIRILAKAIVNSKAVLVEAVALTPEEYENRAYAIVDYARDGVEIAL